MRQDPRIARTEAAIRTAFIRLVEEKGFAHVSVKDICDRAEINRNTFYLHFADKEALMEQVLRNMLAVQAVPIAAVASHLSSASPEQVEDIVRNILSHLSEELAFYRILFTDAALQSYVQQLYRTAVALVTAGAHRPMSTVALSYLIYGFIGVITEWLTRPSQDTTDIVPVLSRLLIGTLPSLYA